MRNSQYPDYLDYSGVTREFLRVTSIHGLRRVGWSKQKVAKVVWAILFLISVIGFIYVVVKYIQDYREYPVVTRARRQYEYTTFPAVTICNQNIFDRDSVQNLVTDSLKPLIQRSRFDLTEGNISPYQQQRGLLQAALKNMPFETRKRKGHQLKDLVLHCAYNERECNVMEQENGVGDFTHVWNDRYGNCFTIGGGKVDEDKTSLNNVVDKPGHEKGLILILNTEGTKYLSTMSPGDGIRLLVHPSTQMPFPDEEGLSLSPATETHCAINLVEYRRKGPPYSTCIDPNNVNRFGYHYSAVACRKICIQEHLKHDCMCVDPSLPLAKGDSVCNLADQYSSEATCANTVERKLASGSLSCDCPSACTEKVYSRSLSRSAWPAPSHKEIINKMLYPVNKANKTYDMNHLVSVKVFMNEIGYTTIEEEPRYTDLSEFMAQLGGATTLFVGVSIISLFEILEGLCTLILVMCVPGMPPWQEDLIGNEFDDIPKDVECPNKRKLTMANQMLAIESEAEKINALPLPKINRDRKIAVAS